MVLIILMIYQQNSKLWLCEFNKIVWYINKIVSSKIDSNSSPHRKATPTSHPNLEKFHHHFLKDLFGQLQPTIWHRTWSGQSQPSDTYNLQKTFDFILVLPSIAADTDRPFCTGVLCCERFGCTSVVRERFCDFHKVWFQCLIASPFYKRACSQHKRIAITFLRFKGVCVVMAKSQTSNPKA